MEKATKKSSTGGFMAVAAFAAMYAIGLIYMLFVYPAAGAKIDFWAEWLIRYAVIFGLGIPAFLFISRKAPSENMSVAIKIGGGKFFKYLMLALGAATAGGALGNVIISAVSGASIEDAPDYFGGGSIAGAFLFLCIVPPALEELFFRKILLQRLSAYGSGAAVLGTALAFAVYHTLLTYAQILHVFLLGIVFAYIILRTKNIVYTIALHSLVNLWSVFNTRLSPVLPDPLPLVIPLAILPIMICFIVILIANRKKLINGLKNILKNKPVAEWL